MNGYKMFDENDMVNITEEEVKQLKILLMEAKNRLEYEKLKIYEKNNTWYNFIMYYLGFSLYEYNK